MAGELSVPDREMGEAADGDPLVAKLVVEPRAPLDALLSFAQDSFRADLHLWCTQTSQPRRKK